MTDDRTTEERTFEIACRETFDDMIEKEPQLMETARIYDMSFKNRWMSIEFSDGVLTLKRFALCMASMDVIGFFAYHNKLVVTGIPYGTTPG
jgi:hypothetical protein